MSSPSKKFATMLTAKSQNLTNNSCTTDVVFVDYEYNSLTSPTNSLMSKGNVSHLSVSAVYLDF